MTEEKASSSLPEAEGETLNRAPKMVRPLEAGEAQAQTDANLAKQNQIHQAEQTAENADRAGQIEMFIFKNELLNNEAVFGDKPLNNETMAIAVQLLLDVENKARQGNPNFDITKVWNSETTKKYLERKYSKKGDEKVADNREIKDTLFKGAVAEIRENNPEITNVEICATLLKAPDQIPPTEIAKLQSFVRIQELAATPEDAAIVTAKINNLNFDNGIPDPVLFVQGQIFNDPNLSEASKDAIATELKIPRPTLVTGSDINKAMDAVDAEGNPKYTEKNPLQIRGGVNAYVKPDGSRVARVEVQGVGIREIPWERNERGEYIGLKLSMLKIWAVNEQRGNTDFFGETVNIDNQILSQTDPEKLRKTQQIMEALLGGDAGYDGEVITDEQAEFVSWFAQYVSTKGDAAEGDFDKQAAIENRTNLGIHPNGDITQIDYEVMREAGSFAQGQYGTGSPDYPALQKHLHEMFPEKNIPLTGENKQYDPMADFEEITEFVDDTYQASK